MRIAIPYPCIGCSSSVFRISMSSVPCTNPLALSAMLALLVMKEPAPLDNPEEHRTPALDCQEETVLRCGGLVYPEPRRVYPVYPELRGKPRRAAAFAPFTFFPHSSTPLHRFSQRFPLTPQTTSTIFPARLN